MSHQLGERIRNHAAALDQAAPPIRLDDVRASSRSVGGRRSLRPFAAAAAVVLVVVGGLVAITAVRDPEPEPAAVSAPLSTTPPDTTPTEPSVSEALDEARTRWVDAAVTSYRLAVAEDRNYWSRGCTWTTLVSGGVVTETTVVPSSTAQECPPAEFTVEHLHDLISSWLASIEEFASPEFGDHTLQVEYNEIGVPVTMEYDLANGDDEEASMRVTFELLQNADAVDQESAPASTQPADPSGSPPAPRTFIDEDGLRCMEYDTSTVNSASSGVCFDDSFDELGIRTVEAGDHYPRATIIGATDAAEAVRVVMTGDGAEHQVDLVVVDGWPERIFFADLPAGAVEVRLETEDGRVLSSTTA